MQYRNPYHPDARCQRIPMDDGVHVHIQVVGDDHAPVILLANGLGGRQYNWEDFIDLTRDRYRLVCWDFRGVYESGPLTGGQALTATRLAQDAANILDHLDIDQVVMMMGWSMGTLVTQHCASLFPDRISRIALICPTWGQTLSELMQPFFPLPGAGRLLNWLVDHKPTTDLARRLLGSGPGMRFNGWLATQWKGGNRDTAPDSVRQFFHDNIGPDFEGVMAIARAVSAHNTLPELPDINCPALVIGGRRDTTTPFRHAERIARTLPCAKLVPHPGTHYLMFEDPSIWYEILAFLEET